MTLSSRYPCRFSTLLLSVVLALSVVVPAWGLTVPAPPPIAARAYILQDFNSGRILASEHATERVEPASLTKLLTAYIVFKELREGRLRLGDKVLISEKAWRTPGSRTFVEVGSKVPVEQLLQGVIVQSGNDATVALAEHIAGSEAVFAGLMNQQAAALGLAGSHFVNSTGLPHADHYTTAQDLATLTRALIKDFPEYYRWYSQREFTYNGIRQHNRNKLLWRDSTVDGVKTGHTESAGYCLVASALRDEMRLISVVVGTKSENARARESQALLNYGFRFFETHRLYGAGETVSRARIWKGARASLPLGLGDDLYITLPRGQYDRLQAALKVRDPLIAPAVKGRPYGQLVLSLAGKPVVQKPLLALDDVPEGSFFDRLSDEIRLWFE
ncbi:MAG TPA: D-alanyl-D-alanine carboxypeptidase [Gammaproteobacteria bacterium]|nr:D-alanyl-D-alanine carboxypeptidase [Gammaproteobacteria bacterium]